MSNPSETGLYAYFINVSGTSFNDPVFIDNNITVSAVNSNPELFKNSTADGSGVYLGVLYTNEATSFVGTATDAGGHSIGFIVHDAAHNLNFLVTTSPFTGTGGTLHISTGADDPAFDNWNLNTGAAVCFMAGTRIATPAGESPIETLAVGDLVSLHGGGTAPVSWVGRQTVSLLFADPLRVLPVRITAGALGAGLPARDLLVSPDHALLVDGMLVQAGALVNGVSIMRERTAPRQFVYYHVEVADHSLILAEGVPAETFVDNVDRMAFDNWADHQALYGEQAPVAEMALPRAKSARQVPAATQARILALAGVREAA
jgi:hypothetical protein